MDELLAKHKPYYIVLKSFEGMSKGSAYEERVRLEGIAHLSASGLGFKDIGRKRKSTIAKDFGLKGRARYLRELDTSVIDAFDDLDALTKEAVLVAWSELKN